MLPGMKKYPHIFSPIKIGKLEIKNRIKYASTETNFNYRDGYVSDKEVGYMEAQARGGAGIVTSQGAFTEPTGEGKGYVGMMAIWDDKFIPGLKKIADAIKKHDAVPCLQLMHCGRVGGIEIPYTAGPSNVPQKLPIFRPPKEMTKEEILEGIRKAVPSDVAIGIRLCGEELLDDRGGNTPEESLESIKIADKAGIDYLSVTAGWQESPVSVISRDVPMGNWLYIAERMKKNIKAPVSMAYRLFVPEISDKAIAEGKLDLWEMCRPMIADPFLPKKIMEDRQQDIIPCIACTVCPARLSRDSELRVTLQPSLGHETEPEWGFYGFQKSKAKKKVIVVGSGVSGLQAAAIVAEKGHEVTVYEKNDHLGGQFAAAAHGPWGDQEFQRMGNVLKAQCDKHGAKIVLKNPVTKELL